MPVTGFEPATFRSGGGRPVPLGHTGRRIAAGQGWKTPEHWGKDPHPAATTFMVNVRWNSCLRQRTPTPMRPSKTHPPMPRGTHPHGNMHPTDKEDS